ncbi:MAG: endolytic transglycosylase MltG, partial [Bacteroidota bacterium]
ERKQKAQNLGMSQIEVSTLASIVKGETNKMDEAPRIAGVYINRLKRGIPLQADPTLVFAIGDFSIRRILNKDKLFDSPYNTYKNRGLPPGPINMPSIPTLDAVLNYEDHSYLYFCAKADFSGYHAFAKTLTEHNKYAREFQRALNRERIYR